MLAHSPVRCVAGPTVGQLVVSSHSPGPQAVTPGGVGNNVPVNDCSRRGTVARGRAAARPGGLRGPAAALLAGPAHRPGGRISRPCPGDGLPPGADRGAQFPATPSGTGTAGSRSEERRG